VATTWGLETLPDKPGRDADEILAAVRSGELGGLVVGGVDPHDTADPHGFRAAVDAARFVVALELRDTDVTRAADVVFPVASVTDKAGTFVTWEGRPRSFDAVFTNPQALPDSRVLAGIAEELAGLGMGRPLGFRTVAEVRTEMEDLGPWDGDRAAHEPVLSTTASGGDGLALATWKQLLDHGSMQDGDPNLRATARPAVAKVSQRVFDACGDMVTITGDRGDWTLPAEVADVPDDVVWVPTNNWRHGVWADLASPGSRVTVKGTHA
jgi:NADH-quinone oxidoreductase subunit G